MNDETTPTPAPEGYAPNPDGGDPLFVKVPASPPPDSFAARLRAAREAAGLSQSKLAKLIGVSSPTIGTWEHARSKPSGQKQAAVLRKLKEIVDNRTMSSGLAVAEEQVTGEPREEIVAVAPAETVATPAELTHDPHNPVSDAVLASEEKKINPLENVDGNPESTLPYKEPMPDIPVGNVHTTKDGVVRRRLADDDDREGVEIIDGHRWFTVGFMPPHPRTKKPGVVQLSADGTVTSPEAIPAPQKPDSTPTPPVTPPEHQEPAEAMAEPAGTPQRSWAWWNG